MSLKKMFKMFDLLIIALIALFLDIKVTYAHNNKNFHKLKYPIILVPGDGGSQLEAKLNKSSSVHYFCNKKTDDYFSLWLNLADLVPFVIDCWVDNMKLTYDNKTRTTKNSDGVKIRVPGFGNTSSVEFVDPSQVSLTGYFNILVKEMVEFGYERGKNIRGAPYDFRKSPSELGDYYKNLTNLIEETYSINNNIEVTIICHSMGCPVILYFLNRCNSKWKKKHIKKFVTLASPWGGAVKALKAFSSGDNLGVIVISALTVREDERTFPSLAFLLPNDQFWNPNEILVSTLHKNYTVHNYKEFFHDINYTTGYNMWLDTKDLIYEMIPPDVEVHCLHGLGVQTMEKLEYKDGKFDYSPKITYGDGDGTVNLRSLKGCLKWNKKQSQPVFYQNFTKLDHMYIMNDLRVIDYLKKILIVEETKFKSKITFLNTIFSYLKNLF